MKRTVEAEQYFTPVHLARRCLDLVVARFELASFDLVVEPSAGDGSFFDLLPQRSRVGIDIAPRHRGLVEADFLTWQPPRSAGRVLTIGNPPFGQRAARAFDFLDHACSFSDVVAFILPRSFKKYTFQNRLCRDFHLVDSFDCDEFVGPDGTAVSVRTVFQIWEKRAAPRALVSPPDSHPDFEMRHGHLSRLSAEVLAGLRRDFEFTVPQVGVDFRPRAVETVTRGSHWFIRPLAPGVRERFEQMDFSFLDGMNTAHKSLAKSDIVAAYVAVVGGQPADVRTPAGLGEVTSRPGGRGGRGDRGQACSGD